MIAHDLMQVILESSLRGGAALGFAAIVSLSLRRRSGAVRHAVWLGGLCALLVAPLAGTLLPRLAIPILPAARSSSSAAADSRVVTVLETAESARGSNPQAPRPDRRAVWTWIWAAGALWMLARAARSHARVAALARTSEPIADPRLAAAWNRALTASGAPRTIACRTSATLDVPLACGVSRPLVLVPTRASGWEESRIGAVLAHELAHLRRRDPLTIAVAHVARALYWFHPLAWIAVRELRAESERACDDAVLRAGERPSRYAATLLSFAGGVEHEPAAALAFLRPRGLESRIAGILAARHDRRPLAPGQRVLIGVTAIVAAVALSIAQPVPSKASRAGGTPAPRSAARAESFVPESWWRRARAEEPSAARFRNTFDSSVRIRYAEVRMVELSPGLVGITMPELILENRNASRRVTAVELAFELPTTRDRSWIDVPIPSTRTTRLRIEPREWSVVVPAGDEDRLTIRVIRARFEEGEMESPGPGPERAPRPEPTPRARHDGDSPQPGIPSERGPVAREAPLPPESFEAPPDTPPPGFAPEALPRRADRPPIIRSLPDRREDANRRPDAPPRPRPDDHGWIMARFRNPDDAPVVIVDARVVPRGRAGLTSLPELVIENRSERWVRSLRIRYKADAESHAVSGYDVSIRPHGSVFIHREDYEIPGRAADMTVQILGVRFDDGTVWGTLDSTIDARDEWVYPLSPEER